MSISFRELLDVVWLEREMAKGFRMRSVILLFRLASYAYRGQSSFRYFFRPAAMFYKFYTEFLLGIELPPETQIAPGLRIYHGVGLVVHKGVQIGSHCVLRQGVTIGNKGEGEPRDLLPVIGNNVEFGAGAIVIGNVHIGDNVIIGAGVVVTKDVPPNSIVVGAAVRILELKS